MIAKYQDVYYDPSYGSEQASDKSTWQTNSIAYFGTQVQARELDIPGSTPRYYYWVKAVSNNTVIETVLNY